MFLKRKLIKPTISVSPDGSVETKYDVYTALVISKNKRYLFSVIVYSNEIGEKIIVFIARLFGLQIYSSSGHEKIETAIKSKQLIKEWINEKDGEIQD